MNTFFYSAASSTCETGCHFSTCSNRCLDMLGNLSVLHNLKVLPGGSRFKTPNSMELRSGDILILYARDRVELQALLLIKELFEAFRIILIVGEESLLQDDTHHTLNPRYTALLGTGIDKLGDIVRRMIEGKCQAEPTDKETQEIRYA